MMSACPRRGKTCNLVMSICPRCEKTRNRLISASPTIWEDLHQANVSLSATWGDLQQADGSLPTTWEDLQQADDGLSTIRESLRSIGVSEHTVCGYAQRAASTSLQPDSFAPPREGTILTEILANALDSGADAVSLVTDPGGAALSRLVESTVWVNDAHPAYRRAVASRSEGYHLALAVALALAPLAVEVGARFSAIAAWSAPRHCGVEAPDAT